MATQSQPTLHPTSSGQMFDLSGPSGVARALTRSFLKPWVDSRKQPHNDPKAAGMKARIMADRAEPITMLLRVSYAAVDVGLDWRLVTAWAREFIVKVQEHAERRARRLGIGAVLPFPSRFTKAFAVVAREEGEANVACIQAKAEDVASLEYARKELTDARQAIDTEIAILDERLAASR